MKTTDNTGKPLKPAASDEECSKAWQKIAKIASEHELIIQACGGVMTLAMPEEQIQAGIRERVLRTHCAMERMTRRGGRG